MTRTRWWAPMVLTVAAPVCGQEEPLRRIDVQVTSAAADSVYLDLGRDAGLRAGDEIRLHPLGRPDVLGHVRATSASSARVELPAGTGVVPIGTRGEASVPESRFAATTPDPPPQAPARATPAHPPWSQPVNGWDPQQPLLAPAFGQGPAARPTRVVGRVFGQGQTIQDWSGGRRYTLAELGTELDVANPFHEGGSAHFRGLVRRRDIDVDGGADDASSLGRLDRLSYRWGDDENAPVHAEIGRFWQSAFPELGLLDGIEVARRTGFGDIGASLGFMPEPFPGRESGDDLQAALFWRTAVGDDRQLEAGLAYQKSWHRGSQDRDLLLADVRWRPIESVRLWSAAWVDVYGSGDDVKSGVELTELHSTATWDLAAGHGLGATFTHIRWPDIARSEFARLTPQQIRDNRIDRLDLRTWHTLGRHVDLDGGVHAWQDQHDDGVGGELRLALRDLLFDRGEVALTVFHTAGAFTAGNGVRLTARRAFDAVQVDGGYEYTSLDVDPPPGAGGIDQHAVFGSVVFAPSTTWDVSLTADYRVGDGHDAVTVGLFSQVRF